MPEPAPPGGDRIRAAEVIAALSLATDLALGVELEHGLRSTLFAARLGERLGIDRPTAVQTYYACLLLHVGCTADAHRAVEHYGEGADMLSRNLLPAMFGGPREALRAVSRSVAPGRAPAVRMLAIAKTMPKVARVYPGIAAANCEVAQVLTRRLGLPAAVAELFARLQERWDGKGTPGRARGEEVPLALRIAHVARDADSQRELAGPEHAAQVVRERAGGAFDPAIAHALADGAGEILALEEGASAWEPVLAGEPGPPLTLAGDAIDGALAAMGDFADLASPYLTGHSAGVTALAVAAAAHCRLDTGDVVALRRAALVHDVGRVAVPVRIWQKPGPLTPQERERVRLHAYHSDRILSRSPFLTALAPVASAHHERLDGSGYHRGARAAALEPAARLLAAADAYHAMSEPRPHRGALPAALAAETLAREAGAGQLDPDAVTAVLEAAGRRAPRIARPGGLTEREAEVVGLLARGLQTKQVAHTLRISAKTADRHVQNAYAKIGVSTRAAATLFAMQHGLAAWGELPMGGRTEPP